MKNLPKITELDWKPHPNVLFGGEYAKVSFPNGFQASCLRGGGSGYTRGGTYEIAVMKDDDLRYDTPITEDVLGYLTEEQANKALEDIAALPVEVLEGPASNEEIKLEKPNSI